MRVTRLWKPDKPRKGKKVNSLCNLSAGPIAGYWLVSMWMKRCLKHSKGTEDG